MAEVDKSIIQAAIAKSATDKANQVLFLVHRKELCQQIQNTFDAMGVNRNLCSVSMVQTIVRRLGDIPTPDLIITDEAHHSTANTYRKIYDFYPGVTKLGFTATPIRLNKGGLGEVYNRMITSVTTQWLIENGYLAPYKYYSVPLADTSHLKTKGGDFDKNQVTELMANKEIYGDTVVQYQKLADGQKTIIYTADVETARATADEFRLAGYTAIALDGTTPKQEREQAITAFRNGDIKILTNCELFGEGLDVPDCECVILLRPTQSLSLYIQQSMRSMRYKEGKTATIIDHVGNCYRHGLPDDDREWTLEPKKKQANIVKIKECPQCFAVYPPTAKACPFCGFVTNIVKEQQGRTLVEVDLVQVERENTLKNTKIQDAELNTWEQIEEFRKIKGYKMGWAIKYADRKKIKVPPKYNYMRKFLK